MIEKILPLGSVVELDDGKYTIIGFLPSKPAEDGTFSLNEYVGCKYLEGYKVGKSLRAFSRGEIKNVYFIGYKNDLVIQYLEILDFFYNSIESNGSIEEAMEKVAEKYLNGDKNKTIEILEKSLEQTFGKESEEKANE